MIRRVRSSVTGRFVTAAAALRHPRTTLVERPRVDDRRIRIDVHALGIVRPGDAIVATIKGGNAVTLARLREIRDEIQRWIDDHVPGATAIVVSDELALGMRAGGDRVRNARALVAELEAHVERWNHHSHPVYDTGMPDTLRIVREYAETLAQGVTALGLVLGAEDEDPNAGLPARPRGVAFPAEEDTAT